LVVQGNPGSEPWRPTCNLDWRLRSDALRIDRLGRNSWQRLRLLRHAPGACTLVQSAVLRSHVVCPSVGLSVTLVTCDHKCWKSWKLTAQTISPTPSLFAAKRRSTYFQGMGETLGETRGVVGKKWHAGEQKRQQQETTCLLSQLLSKETVTSCT